MCGIAGLWHRSPRPQGLLRDALAGMMDAIRYRGPDGDGTWFDPEAGLGLGHLRLAIQDLSPAGAQPMASISGRYVLIYNGEIYNVAEVRADLVSAGWSFRGTSDTEVFLAGLEQWGLDEALRRSAGMWAMAIWDRQERSLTLVRDRLGKKPLYVGWAGGALLFGSELKALMSDPALIRRIDAGVAASYLRFGDVPGTAAILEGVTKVTPGTYERLQADGRREVTTYWDLAAVARHGRSSLLSGSLEDLSRGAEEVIDRAVRERLVSDVPVGAFLSGGIDSSLVTALMQKHVPGGARTFSIGFDEPQFDEAPFAEAVARHLGTRHTTLRVTAADALAVVPDLPSMFDEPFADSSQIPTHLVAKLARAEVTVALSGDGGDEIAGGYRRHALVTHWWPRLAHVPLGLRKAAAAAVEAVPARALDAVVGLARSKGPGHLVERLQKSASILGEPGAQAIYARLVSLWPTPRDIMDADALPSPVDDPCAAQGLGELSMMRYLDMATYLPDDILTKVDRASMAVALEARSPLLDHRVVEHFWRLPDGCLVRGGKGKVILRAILSRHVPVALFERPKTGFGIPLGEWLRGPLRTWASDLLASDAARTVPLRPDRLARDWAAHLERRENNEHRIWAVLMLLAWQQRWSATWG